MKVWTAFFVASFKQTVRNRQNLFWSLFFPVVFMVFVGFLGNASNQTIAVAVFDEDRTPLSAQVVKALESVPAFQVRREPSLEQARSDLEEARLQAVITVPRGFGAALAPWLAPAGRAAGSGGETASSGPPPAASGSAGAATGARAASPIAPAPEPARRLHPRPSSRSCMRRATTSRRRRRRASSSPWSSTWASPSRAGARPSGPPRRLSGRAWPPSSTSSCRGFSR